MIGIVNLNKYFWEEKRADRSILLLEKITLFVIYSSNCRRYDYKNKIKMNIDKRIEYDKELLNILPDGVLVLNSDGEVTQINQQAQTAVSYTHLTLPTT